MILFTMTARMENIINLVVLIIVFILILVATYFTTKFVGNNNVSGFRNKNIVPVEICKIGPNKFIQIVKIGDKYIAVALGKDEVEYLTEIDPAELNLPDVQEKSLNVDFKSVFEKFKKNK